MAKLKDLAGLAALGFLGYKLSQGKDQSAGMTPEQNDTLANSSRISKLSDESDALARSNRNMSTGQSAADSTNAGVLSAITAPKKAPNDAAGNQGVLSPKTTVGSKTKSSGMINRQKAEDENNALAKAGSKIPAATSVPVKQKPQLAKPGTGVGASIATIANPVTQDDIEFRRLRDARMAKKIGEMNTNVNAFKNAPMEDQIRQNMNSAGMKRGGAVKKMASGGMTASRRADGIATKGKTRGRIC